MAFHALVKATQLAYALMSSVHSRAQPQIAKPAPMTDPSSENTYDVIPYPSYPFAETHPNRLATVATLFGMLPPPVENCRVLELACARGDNLIPMAMDLPKSEFVGIDLSGGQIQDGLKVVEELGLKNIRMRQMNILELDPEIGQFDYIIAHGVYSWVPPEVQNEILAVFRRCLRPNGVAFISFNTYPGWHQRGMLRDMMLYHIRGVESAHARIDQSKSLLSFLCKAIPEELVGYANIFKKERQGLDESKGRDSYLFHEFLEEHNEPLYFYEFIDRAAQHGLQFLGEANIADMQPERIGPNVAETLDQLGDDIIKREQYIDYVTNGTFRETLLCHGDVPVDRSLVVERVFDMHAAAALSWGNGKPDIHSNEVVTFTSPRKLNASTGHPVSKAALVHLSENWPQAFSFDDLQAAARARLIPNDVVVQSADEYHHDTQMLAGNLLKAHLAGAIELHVRPPQLTTEVSQRPLASHWARFQARNGSIVTNRRHEGVEVNEVNLRLLELLDGTRERAQLLDELVQIVVEKGMIVQQEGRPVSGEERVREVLDEGLAKNLRSLAEAALLIG